MLTHPDLLEKLLEFDPNDRITVEEALAHPYLKALHFPEDEPCADPVNRRDFEFERSYLASEEIRALILREIQHYDAPKKGDAKPDGAGGEAKGAKDDASEDSKSGLGDMQDVRTVMFRSLATSSLSHVRLCSFCAGRKGAG
jgi:serine/threonine protein kinase